MRALALLLLGLLTLPAAQAPALDGVTWIGGTAPAADASPRILLLFDPAAPQAQEVAVELGRLQRQHAGRVRVIALSDAAAPDLETFRRRMGIEVGYPLGQAPDALLAELSTGARGLPHSLLIAADGEIQWRGHPRALAQILPRHLR